MPFENTESSSDAMREMKARLSKLETEHGRKFGLSLVPQPGDVLIVTPPKCGTTLVCAICHALRSGGDTSYDEINMVIPCLEMAYDSGITDLRAVQNGSQPFLFKTHCWYHDTPKGQGARYIFVVRDPLDAGVSFYHFLAGWFFNPEDISLDQFLVEFMLKRGAPKNNMENASQWHNMASWYPHRNDPNVLWLFYEDIVKDLPKYVDIIANFLQVKGDCKELRQLAVEQSSIQFMRQHPTKFDEHMLKLSRNEACGLPPRAGLDGQSAGKVREGKSGKGKDQMSPYILEAFEKKWNEVLVPSTGCATYAELRQRVNQEFLLNH